MRCWVLAPACAALALLALSGCRSGSSTAVQRDDEGRRCRLEVAGRPGRYEARVEASSVVAGDAVVETGLRWRKAGSRLWHPAGSLTRTDPSAAGVRRVPLPDLVAAGDLVRLEVTWLDADGNATWRRALEFSAP